MSCAMGLIALGVGYLVLLSANKEKEGLKLLGQVIGILIMIAAVLSSLCAATKCMKKGECSMSMAGSSTSGKAPMCALTGKSLEKAAE